MMDGKDYRKGGRFMKRVQSFFLNILILTATALLMRMIGVAFNVYLSQRIGAAGIGLFQLILSVYSLSITFASSGINLTTTHLVLQELEGGREKGARMVMRRCIAYSVFFGVTAAFVLFWQSEYICSAWLKDMRPLLSLKVLAVSLPFISMSSALNGYFNAVRRVIKSASAQVFEQVIKIGLTIVLLGIFLPKGLEYACVAIVIASSLSEVLSFLLLFVLYRLDFRRFGNAGGATPHIVRRLVKMALPDAVSSYARSALLTVEHLLIPAGFKKSGASSESALAAYGMIHGMVLPIITFPSALLNALASLLVPELAECHLHRKTLQASYIITRVLRITLLFSIGVMGILFAYSQRLGLAIYQSSEAGIYLKLLAPLIPIMYLDTAVDGMLKGLGQQMSSMRYNILDTSLCVAMVYFLIPLYAVKGYLVVLYVSELLNFTLSIRKLSQVVPFRLDVFTSAFKPLFCIVGAVSMSHLLFLFTAPAFGETTWGLVARMTVTLTVYLFYLVALSCITQEDLKWFLGIFLSEKQKGNSRLRV